MHEPVCIVGFGRLGETLATLLAPRKAVAVLEIDAAKQKQAKATGYTLITPPEIARYPTTILCVPISRFQPTLESLSRYIAPKALVMDTCSVKIFPVEIMKQTLRKGVTIIATHPMFGPDSVRNGLANLSIVTWRVRGATKEYNKWNELWRSLGFGVVQATPEKHDQITAYTLAMPHLLGRVMAELALQPQPITTVGYNLLFDVMHRTTNDSWQLFQDMHAYNPYTKQMRARIRQAFQELEGKLQPS